MRKKRKERVQRIRKNERRISGVTYWSSCKAADYFGVCKNTLLAYCKNGLTYLKIGGNYLFTEEWLKDYIDEKTIMQTYREAR